MTDRILKMKVTIMAIINFFEKGDKSQLTTDELRILAGMYIHSRPALVDIKAAESSDSAMDKLQKEIKSSLKAIKG